MNWYQTRVQLEMRIVVVRYLHELRRVLQRQKCVVMICSRGVEAPCYVRKLYHSSAYRVVNSNHAEIKLLGYITCTTTSRALSVDAIKLTDGG